MRKLKAFISSFFFKPQRGLHYELEEVFRSVNMNRSYNNHNDYTWKEFIFILKFIKKFTKFGWDTKRNICCKNEYYVFKVNVPYLTFLITSLPFLDEKPLYNDLDYFKNPQEFLKSLKNLKEVFPINKLKYEQ